MKSNIGTQQEGHLTAELHINSINIYLWSSAALSSKPVCKSMIAQGKQKSGTLFPPPATNALLMLRLLLS